MPLARAADLTADLLPIRRMSVTPFPALHTGDSAWTKHMPGKDTVPENCAHDGLVFEI
jgi:hypothetical protein